ncbi:response regulator [Dictyobacter kobayashii]|uniref:Response regulator n=1 Tax=Dictyobacter kobayashii TaxID=2014872 RepID=A0A402AUQ2_9CHLR|nr:response regulator [Dictyobacter kobayashii]GCE22795.1 response regulator [Dictyobacter kobayashii]
MNKLVDRQAKKRILVVDDSEDMRQLMQQILEEEEIYDLFFAEDGPQAIEQATKSLPDLILMDMSLPGMSGWEAVAYLRKLALFRQTPIIAVTAHVSQADQERARTIGCNSHLGKPFDVITVLDTIAEFLS